MKLALVAFVVVLFGCVSKKTAALSDGVAAGLLEVAWRSADEVLPLGEVRIVRSNPNIAIREAQQRALAWYITLVKEGVISIPQGTCPTSSLQSSRAPARSRK
ncbi:MAG: hypothetical protein HZB13_17750 [Acidobacteria bacterium]|nr:hypothetical protein [Acidobacteriota bacterium]